MVTVMITTTTVDANGMEVIAVVTRGVSGNTPTAKSVRAKILRRGVWVSANKLGSEVMVDVTMATTCVVVIGMVGIAAVLPGTKNSGFIAKNVGVYNPGVTPDLVAGSAGARVGWVMAIVTMITTTVGVSGTQVIISGLD